MFFKVPENSSEQWSKIKETCFASLRLSCWTLSGRRLDDSALFFLSCLLLDSFLDAAKCQASEMPEPFKIPAMAEHVCVWEDCSAKQSCFSPNSFLFSSQGNLVLAPPNAILKEPNEWKGHHGFRLVRKQTNKKIHLARKKNFEKSFLHTVCVHLPNVQPPQIVHFHEGSALQHLHRWSFTEKASEGILSGGCGEPTQCKSPKRCLTYSAAGVSWARQSHGNHH